MARTHRLSASSLHRARHCLYFARLDVAWAPYESSQDALTGTATHACAEADIDGWPIDPIVVASDAGCDELHAEKVERLYGRWSDWWTQFRGALAWNSERPIAYDTKSRKARALPKAGHRNYGDLAPAEIPATIDADAIDGDAVVVLELKTGRQSGLERAATNIQTGIAAVALADLLGKTRAKVAIAKIGEEDVMVDHATLDAFDLTLLGDELEAMVDGVPGSLPNPGAWCQYCPARSAGCPVGAAAVAEVVADVIPATSLVRRPKISHEIQDDAHAAEMLQAIDAVEAFIAEAKKRIRAYADAKGGIVLDDGSVYRRQDVERRSVDLTDSGLVEWLVASGLGKAIEYSSSLTALKRAGITDEQMRYLDNMGGIKRSSFAKYEIRQPSKKGRAA